MTLALPSVMLLYPERKRRKALTLLASLLSNLIHSIPCLNLLETNCQESLGNVTFQGIPPRQYRAKTERTGNEAENHQNSHCNM